MDGAEDAAPATAGGSSRTSGHDDARTGLRRAGGPDHTGGLDHDGPVPKHEQLRIRLEARIGDELAPGDAVASERELMDAFGVSRATVRQAIGQLVSEGRLLRVRGKGTFVVEPRVSSDLHLASFTEDMARRGSTPSTRTLGIAAVPAPEPVGRALGLGTDELVYRLERLRLADGRPMAHELGWYPAAIMPNLQTHDLEGSLYALLRERYGLVLETGEQSVRAEACAPEHAGLLHVEPGAPLLVFLRTTRAGARAVEHMTSRYRGDRYQIQMRLDRRGPAPDR